MQRSRSTVCHGKTVECQLPLVKLEMLSGFFATFLFLETSRGNTGEGGREWGCRNQDYPGTWQHQYFRFCYISTYAVNPFFGYLIHHYESIGMKNFIKYNFEARHLLGNWGHKNLQKNSE